MATPQGGGLLDRASILGGATFGSTGEGEISAPRELDRA